ncbi:SIR2-like domain-containing protein [Aspergillus crustosus]
MLEYGYRYLKKQPPPRDQQKAQERDLSIRNMRYLLDQAPIYSHLQAAQILRRELEECGDFAHWLNAVFGDLAVENDALFRSLKELHDRGATILTTNYDCLLDSYCGLTPVCGLATQDAMTFQWGRRSRKEIFHIHGTYERPRDVILDPIDYYRVRESEGVRRLLEMTLLGSTVLFVGCGDGLGDANLGGLLRWISELQKDLPRTHTMLIKNDDTYNFHPLVRLKYGSNYSDLGPWLWNELLEHKNTTLPANGSRLAAPSNDKRPRSTGGLRGGDSGEGSNLNGSVHRQNEASVRAKAEYDYAPDSENSTSDIPLEAGEIICNIERNSDGWWRGTNSKGKRGLFPSNYVSTLPEGTLMMLYSGLGYGTVA